MKKILIIAVLILTINTIQAQKSNDLGWMFIPEKTIALDKQMHFTGGAFIGFSAYGITYGVTKNRRKSKIIGIITPILIGTLKELNDNKPGGTGFDWVDLGYTVGGGVVGTYTIDFLVGRKLRRDKKRNKI